MKPIFPGAAIGALLAVPCMALAQQASRGPDPADPRAAVPALEYRSVLSGAARQPAAAAATPDKLWRQANDTVAAAAGHAGHAGHATHDHGKPAPAPAAPAAHGKPHGKHH